MPRSCERARTWVSLEVDGELSELESAMLRAHTARCAACAAFRTDASTFTQALRLAPLEPLPAPVVLPSRRPGYARRAQLGAAAAVAVVALGVGSLLANDSTEPPLRLSVPVPSQAQLAAVYLDAPRGLPQKPPSSFRPRLGLDASQIET